jgi:hypothetical protein
MEKNIAAFLDDQAYTVQVCFVAGEQDYTYVTNLKGIAVGDAVVVPVILARRKYAPGVSPDGRGGLQVDAKIGTVMGVDKEVNLPTDADREYSWIIQKVDLTSYEATMTRNNQIVEAVTEAYKKNLRRSFSERILGEMADGPKQQLLGLLGKS